MSNIGRNINTIDNVTITTVEVNSSTATKLLSANPNRIYAKVSLDFGTSNVQCMVREYAAATDNIKKGEVLTRITSGNDNLYSSMYKTMPDNPYVGEISAITDSGTFDVHIIEAT